MTVSVSYNAVVATVTRLRCATSMRLTLEAWKLHAPSRFAIVTTALANTHFQNFQIEDSSKPGIYFDVTCLFIKN